jgi:hypothetical protein
MSPGWPGPAPVVAGSYIYSIDSVNPYQPVLLDLDLSIAGHKYAVADTTLYFSKIDLFVGTDPFTFEPAQGIYGFKLTRDSFIYSSVRPVYGAQRTFRLTIPFCLAHRRCHRPFRKRTLTPCFSPVWA